MKTSGIPAGTRFDAWSDDQQRAYILEAVTEENARTGLIRPEAVSWLVDRLIDIGAVHGGTAKHATALRSLGDPVSPDQKKALGLSARTRLGRDFLDVLTDIGRTDIKAASEAIVYWPWHSAKDLGMVLTIAERRGKVRMMVDTRFCCERAKPLLKVVLPLDQMPLFPLEGCDKWRCTCSIDQYQPELMGPPARTPNLRALGIKSVRQRYEEMNPDATRRNTGGGMGIWGGVLLIALFLVLLALFS